MATTSQLKRRMSVKGTAGTTPAPGKISHIRRESSTFSPPSTARPLSRLSDAGKDVSKAGKTSESSTTPRVTTLGKSVRINTTVVTPPSSTASNNKAPTPTTVKPARVVEGSMGPPPARSRASLSTTMSPTGGVSHTRVSSTSSTLGRPGTKSPPVATSAVRRRPLSISGPELMRQAKLVAATAASSLSSTSEKDSTDSASDEKENTMRPSPRATASMSAASKRRSMIVVPSS